MIATEKSLSSTRLRACLCSSQVGRPKEWGIDESGFKRNCRENSDTSLFSLETNDCSIFSLARVADFDWQDRLSLAQSQPSISFRTRKSFFWAHFWAGEFFSSFLVIIIWKICDFPHPSMHSYRCWQSSPKVINRNIILSSFRVLFLKTRILWISNIKFEIQVFCPTSVPN